MTSSATSFRNVASILWCFLTRFSFVSSWVCYLLLFLEVCFMTEIHCEGHGQTKPISDVRYRTEQFLATIVFRYLFRNNSFVFVLLGTRPG